MILQLSILDPYFKLKETHLSSDYEIDSDYLSNNPSKFITIDNNAANLGDYVLAKEQGNSHFLYIGIIETIDADTDTINARFAYELFDGDIIVTNKSGASYEQHLINLMSLYAGSSALSLFNLANISKTSDTPFAVTTTDGIKTYNLLSYLIRGFKLHGVVFKFTGITVDSAGAAPRYIPQFEIGSVNRSIQLKDNSYQFVNWTVQDSRLTRGYVNELRIVDKSSNNMEAPKLLATYYLQTDGTITPTLNANVLQPTKVQDYLYDLTATDKPTYLSVAQSNLTGNVYSHQIIFKILRKNNMIDVNDLEIGLLSNIVYNHVAYRSILSGYSFSSSDDYVTLIFGNIRNNLNDLLDDTN